jgi:hypothetical protein
VNAGPEKRVRQRYAIESTIELGSIYEILAKQSPASRQRRDWEAARFALRQGVSQLDTMATGGKLSKTEAADLLRAHNLLAEADQHLQASLQKRP